MLLLAGWNRGASLRIHEQGLPGVTAARGTGTLRRADLNYVTA